MDEMERAPGPLWPGGPLYGGESVNCDALLLAALAGTVRADTACDLGCGDGILPLLLAWQRPGLRIDAVELRPAAAARCRENMGRNGLSRQVRVFEGDLRDAPLPPGAYDLAVSNPPFFPAGAGGVSPDPGRDLMRRESATFPALCAAAARLLKPGGAFCLVQRTQRLPELLSALREAGLEPKRLQLFAHDVAAAPTLFVCEARKGGKPGLTLLPLLFQRDDAGRETPAYRKICHWEA